MSERGSRADRGALALEDVSKRYDETVAVEDVSLEIEHGEFVTLLGPSGSGKTTTLRIVGGFVRPDEGRVLLGGDDVVGVPPYKRDIGMVFQSYALFPHMTVAENIAFPLQMRRVGKSDTKRRVEEALQRVRLGRLGHRRPNQLSGGQQQRVALARAIVFNPRLLLMDEPLGALDKKLREILELEIMHLSRELGVTVIYVTHDQEEALVMSDRIAIYNAGRIEQVGTGEELYERPATLFVAEFVGESNIFRGRLRLDGDAAELARAGRPLRVSREAVVRAGLSSDDPAAVVVRPERLRVRSSAAANARAGENAAKGVIREVIYLGPLRKCEIELSDGALAHACVQVGQERSRLEPGAEVEVAWSVEAGILVPDTAPEGQLAAVKVRNPLDEDVLVKSAGRSSDV
jgi:putative spermidine/putrescine transport system ATP-binding protein